MKRIVLIFPVGIAALLYFQPVHAAEVSLHASNSSPKVNERFTVTISLSGNDQTLGTDIVLLYDPSYLVAEAVVEGTLYPTYNPASSARINKDAGLVVLSGSTGFGQAAPANGVFGTVSFVPIKDGVAQVSVDYEPGATNKTGVVGPDGGELLTSAPMPLTITVKRQSFLGALLSFFRSLWK